MISFSRFLFQNDSFRSRAEIPIKQDNLKDNTPYSSYEVWEQTQTELSTAKTEISPDTFVKAALQRDFLKKWHEDGPIAAAKYFNERLNQYQEQDVLYLFSEIKTNIKKVNAFLSALIGNETFEIIKERTITNGLRVYKKSLEEGKNQMSHNFLTTEHVDLVFDIFKIFIQKELFSKLDPYEQKTLEPLGGLIFLLEEEIKSMVPTVPESFLEKTAIQEDTRSRFEKRVDQVAITEIKNFSMEFQSAWEESPQKAADYFKTLVQGNSEENVMTEFFESENSVDKADGFLNALLGDTMTTFLKQKTLTAFLTMYKESLETGKPLEEVAMNSEQKKLIEDILHIYKQLFIRSIKEEHPLVWVMLEKQGVLEKFL